MSTYLKLLKSYLKSNSDEIQIFTDTKKMVVSNADGKKQVGLKDEQIKAIIDMATAEGYAVVRPLHNKVTISIEERKPVVETSALEDDILSNFNNDFSQENIIEKERSESSLVSHIIKSNEEGTSKTPKVDTSVVESIVNEVAKEMRRLNTVEMTMDADNNLISNGNLCGKSRVKDASQHLKKYLTEKQAELNKGLNARTTFSFGTHSLSLNLVLIGSKFLVKFTFVSGNINGANYRMPKEMVNRINQLKSGFVFTNQLKEYIIDYMLLLFENTHKHVKSLSFYFGDLPEGMNLASAVSYNENLIESLINTHYSIIFVEKVKSMNDLEMLTKLVNAEKIVIVGLASKTIQGMVNEVLNSEKDVVTVSRLLHSTIAFIHPIVKRGDKGFSLEETESLSLNNRIVSNLLNPALTTDTIRARIDTPSKRLGISSDNSLTQDGELHAILKQAKDRDASDVYFVTGQRPRMKYNVDKMEDIEGTSILGPSDLEHIVSLLGLTETQRMILEDYKQLSLGYPIKDVGRFRVEILTQRGSYSIIVRILSNNIPTLDFLKVPKRVINEFLKSKKGLILVTGGTGMGKSSTISALLDTVNQTETRAITTLEDPIEFLHKHNKSTIIQREIFNDVLSFEKGVESAFRSNPDIFVIGEVRNSETARSLLRFANSGHVAVATMHTSSILETTKTIIGMFAGDEQTEIRNLLADNLLMIVNQTLIPSADGKGKVPVFEYAVFEKELRLAMKSNEPNSFESQLQNFAVNTNEPLVQLAERELAKLVSTGKVTYSSIEGYIRNKKLYEASKEGR